MFESVAKLDRHIYCQVTQIGLRHGLRPLAKRISSTGDGPMYLYISTVLLLLSHQGENFFGLALAAFMLELPLYFLLKNSIRRIRPCHAAMSDEFDVQLAAFEPSDKFSLPSGHTGAAFVMATVVFLIYPDWSVLAFAWAAVIGLSRIILGVHYPLDILAGALLGITSVYLAFPFLAS
ncbi:MULTISPECIES: phosphatase PAP2 family protein [Shewanella]|uniref:phosphatase PAP2 family protein n=1 Tax=Shewanella TaxID=22 RepID=UPI00048CB658|nr:MULTISPECIES: phosphatase PAP2 family protein [Shewanella]QLE84077.1 phosphatase PAP2 family protein [Shewanella sp. Scap07]